MSAPATLRRWRVVRLRVRSAGAIAAVAALAVLIAIGPPDQPASAASSSGFDQISGGGTTDSAVSVSWTSGLLDDTNTAISGTPADELAPNSDRGNGTGPLSFMYSDFKSLKVTVSQTQNITQQGVTVSWTGGQPSVLGNGLVESNFLQLMECYGDDANGPDPEDCEYGSQGLLPAGDTSNPWIGQRIGDLCSPGATASTTDPPSSADGSSALLGCDPEEPGNASPSHVPPCTGTGCSSTPTGFSIPFVPVSDPTAPAYGQSQTNQYFDEFNTNEVQQAVTNPDGTGQLQFETLTNTQAPGLGCGQLESDGQPRNCWLVIVPRGQYEPNGYKTNPEGAGLTPFIVSSPLSASNWAMRIQVHLDYAPLTPFCPIGTQERETVGTQVITRAMDSWELALNKAANCTKIYGYSAVPEATSTQQLCDPTKSTIGLAFTTIPIGSEAARDDTPSNCSQLPQILYAPVAVSALGFGFNINDGTGYVTTPIKMSPEVLAKALTQVYRYDLPDFYPYTGDNPSFPGPAWSQSNSYNMSLDPDFEKLNPEVQPLTGVAESLAPLLTEDHSAINQAVWQWIQTDPATNAWLDNGTNSASNSETADPAYETLQLGKSPAIDSFPRAYNGVLDLPNGDGGNDSGQTQERHSLDLLPYAASYDDTASKIVTGDNPTTGEWNPIATSPSGGAGWWGSTGVQALGEVFIWGISDTPDLAAYGLIDASLCNDSGSSCVTPSVASVTTALDSAKPDSAGLLEVNPADPGSGGYPLVQVTYAAVATDQSATALDDYADLIAYAAGTGQTAGVGPGDLPPGYLPLPKKLQSQAQAVVAKLRADASGSSGGSGKGSGSSGSGTTQHSSSGTSPAAGGQLTQSSSSSPSEFIVSKPSAVLSATKTPQQEAGAVRWALLVVVIVGAACATSGTVLRSVRVPRWLHRVRP